MAQRSPDRDRTSLQRSTPIRPVERHAPRNIAVLAYCLWGGRGGEPKIDHRSTACNPYHPNLYLPVLIFRRASRASCSLERSSKREVLAVIRTPCWRSWRVRMAEQAGGDRRCKWCGQFVAADTRTTPLNHADSCEHPAANLESPSRANYALSEVAALTRFALSSKDYALAGWLLAEARARGVWRLAGSWRCYVEEWVLISLRRAQQLLRRHRIDSAADSTLPGTMPFPTPSDPASAPVSRVSRAVSG